MGREFELKYAASEEVLEAVTGQLGGFRRISMETHYYDTPDGALQQRRYTLRLRRENDLEVCTVKTPGCGHSRGEWQVECGNIEAAIPELCKLGAPEALKALTCHGVQEVCGARFTRLAKKIQRGDTALELALDRGVLIGGGLELPLCEIEVELLSGSEETACVYAQALAAAYRLQPETKSKFRRAMDLAKGE